jgi:hypothetical protein
MLGEFFRGLKKAGNPTFAEKVDNNSDFFLFNKTNRRTNFPVLFCQEILNVSDSSSAHHQEFSTVHSALVYVTKPGKYSSEACAIACQNCTGYSVFPSGMTSHSKIVQFNLECKAPLINMAGTTGRAA